MVFRQFSFWKPLICEKFGNYFCVQIVKTHWFPLHPFFFIRQWSTMTGKYEFFYSYRIGITWLNKYYHTKMNEQLSRGRKFWNYWFRLNVTLAVRNTFMGRMFVTSSLSHIWLALLWAISGKVLYDFLLRILQNSWSGYRNLANNMGFISHHHMVSLEVLNFPICLFKFYFI